MKPLKIFFIVFAFVFVFIFMGISPTAIQASPSGSSEIIKEALDQYWQYLLREDTYYRQRYGLKIEKLPAFSLKKSESEANEARVILSKLEKVNPAEITYDEKISYELLKWTLENLVKKHPYFWVDFSIAAYRSPIPYINSLFSDFRFREKSDTGRYLRLLEQYPGFIEEITALLKQQSRKKIIIPKPALKLVISYQDYLIQPPDKSFLYVQAERLKSESASIFKTQAEVKEFQEKVSTVISTRVNPALEKLLVFITGDYLKNAPETLGLWQYPGGKDYYGFLVKYHTTLGLSAEEVHQIGLREIDVLKKKLDAVRGEVKFNGDLDAFLRFLKSDPRFTPGSPDEVGERLTRFKKAAEAQLGRFFPDIPKAPCGVKRLDPLLEASQTYGFYQPPLESDPTGYYYYNASNLEKKSILNAASAALILHELLPGHHFQIALQAENKSFHPYRRELFITAYSEGWAEYAASLGEEIGIYKDPYEKCGRIMQDLFMAVRLVVDTGMNYFQWPPQKAKQLMKTYTLMSDVQIETETLRYSTGIPGQALGYKIGSLKIMELREKAEKRLGAKFDMRQFHHALLGSGTMPLFLLEEHIERFIEEGEK